jgi:deoxyxylulose-5-phosphate synthase
MVLEECWNGRTRIRRERQEYPNKGFDEAINEKLAVTKEIQVPIAKDA